MTLQGSNPTFENVSQRAVFSYQRQMPEFAPVVPESLSPSERDQMKDSQRELNAFFRALYQSAYEQPASFGLPAAGDVHMEDGSSKEYKREVTKQVKKARDKLVAGVDFLYHVGTHGTPVEGQLRLDQETYASFFAKNPRVKFKFVKGMQAVGLTVSEQEDAAWVGNTRFPGMMPALQALATACTLREDERLAAFLFARCDFRALDAGYQPDTLDMLRTALSPIAYEQMVELHNALTELAYQASVSIGGVHNWAVRYQGKRAIKSTPLLEFEYDERQKHSFLMRVKCASTNRLVPLLPQQPEFLQQDFFHHANGCGGSSCGWCETRKGMGPSVLKYGGEQKTICWYMQRHFWELDGQAVDLVRQYALLHEALLAA